MSEKEVKITHAISVESNEPADAVSRLLEIVKTESGKCHIAFITQYEGEKEPLISKIALTSDAFGLLQYAMFELWQNLDEYKYEEEKA